MLPEKRLVLCISYLIPKNISVMRYSLNYSGNKEEAIAPYLAAAAQARKLNIGLNAGHDLDLFNLNYLIKNIPWIDEVSIGHALICDSIYLGFQNTIQLYKRQIAQ